MKEVKLKLDLSAAGSYCEIDAIQLWGKKTDKGKFIYFRNIYLLSDPMEFI